MQELEIVRGKIQNHYRVVKADEDLEWNRAIDLCTNIINAHLSCENAAEIERSSRDNDGWIPVEERLPEISRTPEEDDECPEFNVTIRGASESTTLKYSPDGTWFDQNGYVYDVIAWRPLPEPYRLTQKGARENE